MRSETATLPHGNLPLDVLVRHEVPAPTSVPKRAPGKASDAGRAADPAPEAPMMFASVSGLAPRNDGAWKRAALVALVVHALLLGVAVAMPAGAPAVEEPEEPELVFVQFSPGPAAAPPALVAAAAAAPAVQQEVPPRPRPIPQPKAELVAPVRVPEEPVVMEEVEPQVELSLPTRVAAHTGALVGSLDGLAGASISGMGTGGTGTGEGGVVGGTGVGLLGDAPVPAANLAHPPRVLRQVEADYPRWARRNGITGRVIVRLVIDTEGRVESDSVRILKSVPELDEAAMDAARGWRFSPGSTASGRKVRVMVDIPFQFSLR